MRKRQSVFGTEPRSEPSPGPRSEQGDKPHALIVDDSLTVRMDLRAAFYGAGFHVTTCDTKAAALQALRSRTFAVIVLDVLLPDGTGLDVLKELRALPAHGQTPVMILSTEVEVKQRLAGLNAGADEYVGKPYDTAYVLRRAADLAGSMRRTKPSVPPAPTSSPASSSAVSSSAPSVTMGKKVLIADPDPAHRRKLVEALRREGFETVTAGSGEEALALLEVDRVDAVLLDYRLPGIGGLETCRRIRAESVQRFVAVMLMAGEGDETDVYRKAMSAGADDLVVKLADPILIKVRLRAVLNRGRRDREGRISSIPTLSSFDEAGSEAAEGRDRISALPPSSRTDVGERSSRPPSLRPEIVDERSGLLSPVPSSVRERDPRSVRRGGGEHAK
jgi:DNA-binding response OmpR family regulator